PIVAVTSLGFSPAAAGLVMLPGGLLMGLLAPVVGRLADRVSAARLTVPGLAAMAGASLGFALLQPGDGLLLLALHLALAVGFAFTITPLYLGSLAAQPRELVAHASALLSTVQQIAAGAGTIVVIAAAGLGSAVGFVVAALLIGAAVVIQGWPRRRRGQ
ncbi:MAG: MFS transporter, partial [Herbiconiux sp.]|nr:MFS transporter [Herbiconiux sp.]